MRGYQFFITSTDRCIVTRRIVFEQFDLAPASDKDKNKEKNNIEIKLAFGHQARSRMLKVGKDSSQASVTRWQK